MLITWGENEISSICNMCGGVQEMASDSMKKLREELTKEAIRDAQVAQTDGARGSDLLTCPECGKNNCSYTQVSRFTKLNKHLHQLLNSLFIPYHFQYFIDQCYLSFQAQTLCSDEPMTTFAFCNDCGSRWIVSY